MPDISDFFILKAGPDAPSSKMNCKFSAGNNALARNLHHGATQPKNKTMSNKEDNLLYRIKAVQTLDRMYYRKGDRYYSHHRVWQNHARRIFGINYTTYANYLRQDVSQLPDLMEGALRTVRVLDELLNGRPEEDSGAEREV